MPTAPYGVALDAARLRSLGGTRVALLHTKGGDSLQVVSDEASTSSKRPVLVLTSN